jgi:hypothetical protein
VEDWERFFIEKSRRRFERERHDRLRTRAKLTIAIGLIALIVVGSVVRFAALP